MDNYKVGAASDSALRGQDAIPSATKAVIRGRLGLSLVLVIGLWACSSVPSEPLQTNHVIVNQSGSSSVRAQEFSASSEAVVAQYRLRFIPTQRGDEVMDKQTGLLWQRCLLGQKWESGACTGKALEVDLRDAVRALSQRAKKSGLEVDKLWRLPTAVELSSLVLCSSGRAKSTILPDSPHQIVSTMCHGSYQSPVLDTSIFPHQALPWVWSGSRLATDAQKGYFLYLGNGEIGVLPDKYQFSVRAVRSM